MVTISVPPEWTVRQASPVGQIEEAPAGIEPARAPG